MLLAEHHQITLPIAELSAFCDVLRPVRQALDIEDVGPIMPAMATRPAAKAVVESCMEAVSAWQVDLTGRPGAHQSEAPRRYHSAHACHQLRERLWNSAAVVTQSSATQTPPLLYSGIYHQNSFRQLYSSHRSLHQSLIHPRYEHPYEGSIIHQHFTATITKCNRSPDNHLRNKILQKMMLNNILCGLF